MVTKGQPIGRVVDNQLGYQAAAYGAQAAAAEAQLSAIRFTPEPRDAEMWTLRRQYLSRQLSAMRARIAMLQGKKLTFDEESKALYDAVAPTKPESEFESVLAQLSAKLPGDGSLIGVYHDRYVRKHGSWLFAERRLEVISHTA